MNQAQQTKSAFNLITEGVGYLNRMRLVTPKRGDEYHACTINAMIGVEGAVEYISIDCRIVGAQAKEATRLLFEATKDLKDAKIIVGFRVGDAKPEFYELKDRETGEIIPKTGLKGRLLQLTFAKVDGEKFAIPLVERPSAAPAQDAAPASTPEGSQRERVETSVA